MPHAKPTKRLTILRFASGISLIITFIIFLLISTPKTPAMIYEEGKTTCPSELWLIDSDAVFYDILPKLTPPYPKTLDEIRHEYIVGFACTEQAAEQKRDALQNYAHGLIKVLGLFLWLIIVSVIVAWWSIEELRLHKKRLKQNK